MVSDSPIVASVTRLAGRFERLTVERPWFTYLALALLTTVTTIFTMKIYAADMHVLLNYNTGGDSMWTAASVKGQIEHHSLNHNPSLGAPVGADWTSWPNLSVWHTTIDQLLGLLIPDAAVVMNLYYLAGYPLAALTALFVLRRLGVSRPFAFAAGLIFAFIPDHYLRNESHYVYSLYYLVPLAAFMLLTVASGRPLWSWVKGRPLPILSADAWLCMAFAVATAIDNEYHFMFTLVFLAVAAAIGALRARTLAPIVAAAAIGTLMMVCFLLEATPTMIDAALHGSGNAFVAQRQISESEAFALKLTHLVLPIADHRVPAFNAEKEKYDQGTATNQWLASLPALGVAGTIGFVLLLGTLTLPLPRFREQALMHDLGALVLAAFLLGTVGGLGALIALFLTPAFRAYDRISPFISCFSIFGFAIACDITARLLRGRAFPGARVAAALLIALLAVFDQTPVPSSEGSAQAAALSSSDDALVAKIEQAVPPGSKLFELPYIAFPESAMVNQLPVYGPFRPYLHSHTLRWSFGAMKGSNDDQYVRTVSALSPPQLATELERDGFAGVLVQRTGYQDGGAAVEAGLRTATAGAPLISPDGTMAFYRLPARHDALSDEALREEILSVIGVSFGAGFYAEEGADGNTWHWAGERAALALINSSHRTVQRTMSLDLRTGSPETSTVSMVGAGVNRSFGVSSAGTHVELSLELAPGLNTLHFSTNAKLLVTASDPRQLAFAVANFHVAQPFGALGAAAAPQVATSPPAAIGSAPVDDGAAAFTSGFSGAESNDLHRWHWATSQNSTIVLHNPSKRTEHIRMRFTTGAMSPCHVTVFGGGIEKSLDVTPAWRTVELNVTLPPGQTTLRLHTDARGSKNGADPRVFYFSIIDLRTAVAQ